MASTKEAETYIGKNVCLSVTIIRHAETEMNAQPTRVLQGQADVPINASGQKQASAVAWRLKKETFDHIFCSDLTRAVQTANEVKTYHPDIGITLDRRLREMDLGDLTGMTWNEAKKMLKAEDQTFDQHLKRSGESNSDFEERVVEFYTDLIENYIVKPHRELMENALKSQGSGLTDQLDVHVAQEERRLSVITRSAGTTPRSSFPGPLPTPVRSLMPTLSWSAEAPQSERKSPARNQPSLLKLKRVNLLIITHGGWIQRLLKHLVDELGFPTEGESHARSFPKNTGVYRFSITKMMKRDGDYEWSGSFSNMNSVSHLSRINKGLSSKDSSPYQSPRHSPTALRKPSPLGHVVAASGVTLPSNGTAPPAQIPTVQVQAAETNSAASTFRRSLGW